MLSRYRVHVSCLAAFLALPLSLQAAARHVPLIDAVKRSDITAVRALVSQGDVNAAEADGMTALHWAVHLDDLKMTDLLIQAGAKVQAVNEYQVTPLALACMNGNAAIIEQLLKAGADPNTTMAEGETALMTAARTGEVSAVKVLLTHGANVNARDGLRSQTALMWAAAGNNAAVVRSLIDTGADLNARTRSAEKKDDNATVEFKANTGVSGFSFSGPEPTSFNAFLFAVRAGSLDAVRALIDAGANVNDVLSDGTSALVLATLNAHWELADYLLDRSADPNAAAQGWTALHQVIRTRRPSKGFGTPGAIPTGNVDSVDLIKKLIAKGANINARMTKNGMRDGQRNKLNRMGATPFLLAAKNADMEVMRVLVSKGANPLTPNVDGSTPLMVAAGVGVWNPGEDGGTLLGSEPERFEAVKYCVELGGEVNGVNEYGETPLHGAAYMGASDMVEFLVERGAKLDATNDRGWTPLTIAQGVFYSDFYKEQKETAVVLRRLMQARGLSIEDQIADRTVCQDCYQTRGSEAARAVKRDQKLESDAVLVNALKESR